MTLFLTLNLFLERMQKYVQDLSCRFVNNLRHALNIGCGNSNSFFTSVPIHFDENWLCSYSIIICEHDFYMWFVSQL